MAYLFRFNDRDRLLSAAVRGEVSGESLVEFYWALDRYAKLHHPRFMIVDWSGAKEFKVPASVIRNLARMPSSMPEVVRVVVAPEDHIYGMARMFQALTTTSRPHFHVVRTQKEARQLLRLNDDSRAG